jgi:histidinol-phosphate aminotransferase
VKDEAAVTTQKRIERLLNRWVRPEIRSLSAYHVPDAGGLIKLDAMENPYSWPPELREKWLARLGEAQLNRYPHPQAPAVRHALRGAMGIPGEAGLLLGNGSDELIQMIAMTVGGPGRVILSVDPGFVMYRMIATFTGMEYIGVPLCPADFSLDIEALLSAVEQHQPAVIFLAYPNNPTGNLFSESELNQVIERAAGLVVIDEAYAPFTDASFVSRLGRYDNLLVMRTVSKMGLAGLRLGLLAGPAEWLDEIDKTRLPYNINVLTQISAVFAFEHRDLFEQQTRAIREERARLYHRLQQIEGLRAFPSEANFILLRVGRARASAIHAGLRERGVLVKNLHGAHPSLDDCLRVTVGTSAENQAFLNALEATL